MTQNLKKAKMSTNTIILITVAVIVFISMSATIVYLLLQQNTVPNNDVIRREPRPTLITKDNIDETLGLLEEPVEDGFYEVSMNTNWTFQGSSSNAFVENVRNNTRTVYFDVKLADTGELVYSSPYIPVGTRIQGFTLDSQLNPGDYSGLVTYYLVDDNKDEVSNLTVRINLEVK